MQLQQGTFAQRFLYRSEIESVLTSSRKRAALYAAARGHIIEVKAAAFGPAMENARADHADPRRNAIIIQSFVDELYRIAGLGRPPEVQASVRAHADGSAHEITWNIKIAEIAAKAGPQLNFHLGTPLTAGAVCNKYLWSAAEQKCDLFVGQPMSTLIGDKLYETVGSPAKSGELIRELKGRVEFPDVRALVNSGALSLRDVLALRDKAVRFRRWLQSQADRDGDAIIAYHHEVAKEAGYIRVGRKALNLFGVMGGGALGSVVGTSAAGPIGAAVGGMVGAGVPFLLDLGAKLGADWKPVVFGDWMRARIAAFVLERRNSEL